MKNKILLLTVLSFSTISFSQDNTLPTTGNVGIGTLNPSSKLDVNGSMIIDSTLLIKDSLRVNKDIRTMGRLFVEDKVVMKNNAVVRQNFRVVGNSRTIGNQRIDGLLKLPSTGLLSTNNVDAGNFELLVLNMNGTVRKINYDSLVAKIGGGIYSPAPISKCGANPIVLNPQWANGPNKLFSACPQVYVGIGTDTPLHSLDVRGRGYFKHNLGVGVEPIASTQLMLSTDKSTGYCADHHSLSPNSYSFKAIVYDEVTKGFGIYSDLYQKDVFAVFSNGQIIVSNATEKIFQLESNGLIRGRQIKLDLDTWADYVFDEDYVLMPLEDVEAYVKEEKHLPNVPSEEQLIEEGLDLEEMNKLLMEKVEELTLYLIEQNKSIEELKARLVKLEVN